MPKNFCLFFHNQEIKEEMWEKYLKPYRHFELDSYENHKALGLALGYPPKAVEFYSSGEAKRHPEKNVGLHFCGVGCASSVDDMEENATWLWENYPHPDKDILIVGYYHDFDFVDYGDIERVRELKAMTEKAIREGRKPSPIPL